MSLPLPAAASEAIISKIAHSLTDAVMSETGHLYKGAGKAVRNFRSKSRYPVKKKKNYKKKTRQMIGEQPGSSTCKVREVQKVDFLYDGRTLNSLDILSIPHTTGDGDNRNERQRQVANVRGWKICASIDNQRTNPLYFNIAVVVTKNGTFGTNDFFRGRDDERSMNFSTGLTSNEFHCLPINTDKYHVLMHRRILLNGSSAVSNVNYSGSSYAIVDKWVTLGRQIRYETIDTATTANEDARLVFWADDFGASATTAIQTDAFKMQASICCYFRDPMVCCR